MNLSPEEYSERFDDLRKKAMQMGFYKYGPARENMQRQNVDMLATIRLRLDAYERTQNTEFLVDVANFAMMEFMYPQLPGAHYEPTDSDQSPGIAGMGSAEMERWKEIHCHE